MMHTDSHPKQRADRGVPPPPTFDIETLPDSGWLTTKEVAAVLRLSPGTLENWRRVQDHPLKWATVDGRPLYRVHAVRTYINQR